ncbi:unnamed protein product [Rotaria sordida]|uniref:Uncharacterized protein n=1 Tax=Rotaria sordida TaxID=392033 RepID=A0A813MQT4_9BILA|nr:unnamed protein product [Rotaria sordida]
MHHLENALADNNIQRIKIQNAQQDKQKYVQLRSVLWPKICFTVLRDHHDYQRSRDPNHNQIRKKIPMPLAINDFQIRSKHGHCSIDSTNETCEKFFQIWSHKAANISNDLIEFTIRRMQSDRLHFLFQTRNEITQRENISPICQISTHISDDLKRINEYIRRFCLSTRNLYRHLRSDSRIYPKMCIELDEGIIIKICRFIFKTKVLIKILSKEEHLNIEQREQLKIYKIKQNDKQFDINDPYKNITKAFIALQSNFEILFGDIVDKDFFQNAKTAVQALPIILDTSKTIRLICCALYKLTEPEREAEAEAIRQRRLNFCIRDCGSKKQKSLTKNIPINNHQNTKFKTINNMLKRNQSQITHTKTSLLSPKINSKDKSTNQQNTKTKENSKRIQSPKSQSRTPNTITSKTNKSGQSSSITKTNMNSSKKNSTKEQQKKKKPKNKNASTTNSISFNQYNENTNSININNLRKKFKNSNSDQTQILNKKKFGWTTWLHNTNLNLTTILPSNQTNINMNHRDVNPLKPLLTTWASLERISKM